MAKPSPSQLQALEWTRDHGDPWWGVFGQAMHGGWSGTMAVLFRNKWVSFDMRLPDQHRYKLTKAGRKALKENS